MPADQPTLNDRSRGFFSVDRVPPMFGGGNRDWSVDVLRCLSCFMVCAIHASDSTIVNEIKDIGANEYLHHEIYRMALASPTVFFVMVSGIFFLSPERNVTAAKVWKKNVPKMAFAYIFWSVIYAIYRIHRMDPAPDVTPQYFLQQCMIQQGHLWYIPMILGLYIICPILRPITATYDKRLFRYIIVIFMGGMILWSMYNWPTLPAEGSYTKGIIEKTPMGLICQYPFWMLFGWIAYTYRPNRGFRYLIYFLGALAFAVGVYFNIQNWFAAGDTGYTSVTQKFSILAFFKNIALFYFIVTVFSKHEFSHIGKVILRKWSDYTLIIYLIHEVFLLAMFDNNFLYGSGVSPWIGVWVYALIAYVGGGVVAIAFHLFWDPIKKTLFPKKEKKTRSQQIYEKLDSAEEEQHPEK